MPDYQDGRIYRLVCNKTGLTYIGSTCDTLSRRLAGHRNKYYKWKAGLEHKCGSFKILEEDDYKIHLVENFPCDNKKELTIRERHWYDEYKKEVELCNLIMPYRHYEDLQAQRKACDNKRKNNPERIDYKRRNARMRYCLKQQLSCFNLFD
jgi:hypothetical protein